MRTHARRATLADIARTAGVSKSAVSFALNGRPGVSEALRERILAIAAELQYRPHSAALALGRSRVDVIGLALNRPARALGTEAFFADLISGIQAGLSPTHTGLQMQIVSSLEEELDAYAAWQGAHRVDGVILIDPRDDDPRIRLLLELGMPAVQIGSHPSPDGSIPSVWIDDAEVSRTLFTALHELGHRRIAHVAGPEEFEHTMLRISALRECAERLGAEPIRSIPTDYSAERAEEATRELLGSPIPPTAIVYDNDVMAVAGLGAAQELGVRVPKDVSIASFDDSVMARLVRPSITALTRDTFALGELAARTLMAQLASDAPVASVAAAAPVLALRSSTKPPHA
jgi:DNA-binding LacI/PurR family transcriptional regulator